MVLVRSIYESCRALGVDFKEIKLGGWLMFQQAEKEYPARNTTLKPGYEFHITTLDYSKTPTETSRSPLFQGSSSPLLEAILKERQEYTARVVVRGFVKRSDVLCLYLDVGRCQSTPCE